MAHDHDLTLRRGPIEVGFDAESLEYLLALDAATPALYRRQERDSKRLEDLLQDMGRYKVGTPGASALTKPAVLFKRMAEMGLVYAVKDPEGPIAYRLSQLGERLCFQVRIGRLNDEIERLRPPYPEAQRPERGADEVEDVEEGEIEVVPDRPALERGGADGEG